MGGVRGGGRGRVRHKEEGRLLQVLADPGVSRIVAEKRHHLNQFGFPLVEAALRASGRRIVVLEDECG